MPTWKKHTSDERECKIARNLPYITRSCFFTDLEGFSPSRSVGMPRDPLYHLERRKGKLRLSRAKIKLNQRLSRKPKPYHLLRLSRGCHQTIPTSLEELNHTIFTSLEGQNHTNCTSLEEQNHTISTYLEGRNHTISTSLEGKIIPSLHLTRVKIIPSLHLSRDQNHTTV